MIVGVIFSWLLKNWVAVAGAAVLAFAGVTEARLHHAKADLAQSRADYAQALKALNTCQRNVKDLRDGANVQNKAIEALHQSTLAKQQAYEQAQLALKGQHQAANAEAAMLLATKAQGDRCVAARRLIEETVK